MKKTIIPKNEIVHEVSTENGLTVIIRDMSISAVDDYGKKYPFGEYGIYQNFMGDWLLIDTYGSLQRAKQVIDLEV